jgi:DNA-binding protein YbaB
MQKMQRLYEKDHKVLEENEFTYTASDAVKITLKGNLDILSLEILDDELLSKENKEDLIQLLKLAYKGAKDQIDKAEDELAKKYQSGATGGIGF